MDLQGNLHKIVQLYSVNPADPSPILIPNSDRTKLAGLFRHLGYATGAEIGVGGGVYSEILCREIPGVRLYCVDAWQPYPGYTDFADAKYLEDDYNHARGRLSQYNVEIIRKMSMEAVKDFAPNSLDFVYIDANHFEPYISQDIGGWSDKVRPGGIVSGHDYHREHADVQVAVCNYATTHNINPWFIVGNPNCSNYPELIMSWFWVKP